MGKITQRLTLTLLACLLWAGCLTGCGGNRQNSPETTPTTLPVSQMTQSDAHFVYIELDPCYPAEESTLTICLAEDKKRENPIVLTYDPAIGGYGILLEEGTYEIRLVCDAPGVAYDQSRYIVVDAEHSYYHVRFTETAYRDFD